MPALDVQYSLEYEVERVRYTLQKLTWFKEKGYRYTLPREYNTSRELSDEELLRQVTDDYTEDIYVSKKELVLTQWNKLVGSCPQTLTTVLTGIQDSYTVRLTRYGVGGSYHFPNTIIVNTTLRTDEEMIKTIFHEMIHLAIHPLIEKMQIDHWNKERIVDLLSMKLHPAYGRLQNVPIDTSRVDSVFETYYPNIRKSILIIINTLL